MTKINSKDILGKKIISEKEGEEVAIAQDLFFDVKNKKVVAVLSDTNKGLENAKAVLLKNVKSIDESILIKAKSDLRQSKEIIIPEKDKRGKNQTIVGSNEVTDKGEELGKIKFITFDRKSGQITEITSIDKGEEKKSKIDKIISLSPKITVVKAKVKNKQSHQDPLSKLRTMF